MNNGNVSTVSVFASTKDYTMINIFTLKINGMKNLPNLTQCQKNLYCIYRFQVERFSIHSMKHLYSFFFSILPSISSQNQNDLQDSLAESSLFLELIL